MRLLASVVLALEACVGAATLSSGLTLHVYDNTALASPPVSTTVVEDAQIDMDASMDGSAELVGSITFPAAGTYEFTCTFENTTLGWVWIDGHMVCSDGNAYKLAPGSFDNPLPVRGRRGLTLPFRAHVYNNAASTDDDVQIDFAAASGCYNDTAHDCGFTSGGARRADNDWTVAASECFKMGKKVAGVTAGDGREVWCGDSLPDSKCQKLSQSACSKPCPGNASETCGDAWVLQTLAYAARSTPKRKAGRATLAIAWAETSGAAPPVPVPVTALSPDLPPAEARRDSLQRSVGTGWGAWLHYNMMPIVKLPEAATVSPKLCRISTGACIDTAFPDGTYRGGTPARVGLHAPDRSYVQYFVGPSSTVPANVSIQFSVGNGRGTRDRLRWQLTPVDCGGTDCSDYEVRVAGRYAWFRAGNVSVVGKTLTLTSAGLGEVVVHAPVEGVSVAEDVPELRLPLKNVNLAVGISTDGSDDMGTITRAINTARTAEQQRLLARFGGDAAKAESGTAVGAAAMWTLVFNPFENNGLLMPVSRAWNFAPGPINSDWTYAVFDWDNLFATLLAALDGGADAEAYAYSNLFQVMKSKTAAGFVPNYAAGGMRSQDRTEPPVGAKVTLEVFKKFNASWVVDVVWDDLLDWNDWFLRRRILQPAGLVALGSFNEQGQHGSEAGGGTNIMQAARYESGLDNSPMYDGEYFDGVSNATHNATHLMQLYDVGMSAMFVQECYALAELAALTGRGDAIAAEFKARGDSMQARIAATLWDEELEIFSNRFPNGSFYPRISPTSFYAMQAHAPTDMQARAMVQSWLTNASRFCISESFETTNTDTCYWGLPSISADDPAFPPLGYWRGYIWGPMAQLTHWSLQEYDHVPEVRAARKTMTKQLNALMLSQWRQHRHICENYNPHKTADTSHGDCSGTTFYHWGALTGLTYLVEEGLW